MSSENGWIPWNERKDISERFNTWSYSSAEWNCSISFLIPLGKVPDKYISDVRWECRSVVKCFYEKYLNENNLFNKLPAYMLDTIDGVDYDENFIDGYGFNGIFSYDNLSKDGKYFVNRFLLSVKNREEWAVELFSEFENIRKSYELIDKEESFPAAPVADAPAAPAVSDSPAVPAAAPADETSGGRTVIDEKLKYDIGVFIKKNPNCSNRAIARNFNLGTGTISSNPELKAYVERCKQLNIQSMENNPNFDNDPFSNGRGRRNE